MSKGTKKSRVEVLPSSGIPNKEYYIPNGNGTDLNYYVADNLGNLRFIGYRPPSNQTSPKVYTTNAPSTFQHIINQSTHNLSNIHKITVYDSLGNEVETAININFTNLQVTIESNINLINSKIIINGN